jgi:leader peptidase (prepilin peptidase)/N-methyltransferase
MFRILGTVLAGLLGLAFGSYLNVCLSRWPAGESVVKPRSHCRSCGRTLTWWENVPLVSWLALRGGCRTCKAGISGRYPIVELAVGALWATIAFQAVNDFLNAHALAPDLPVSFSPLYVLQTAATVGGKMLLVWLLVGLAALDAEHFWLPDIVTLPGILLGVAVSTLRGDPLLGNPGFSPPILLRLLNLAFAIMIAAGIILLLRWIYWLIRRREGIGLGDAKLMALLAAWLGLPGALLAFVIGVVLGALAGAAVLGIPRFHRAKSPGLTRLPLGTFLCIGGIVAALWGPQLLAWYLRWSGLSR